MSGRITPRGGLILLEKELRLLFKNKRRIFLLFLIPIILLIMGVIAGFTAGTEDSDTGPVNISVLDESPSNITSALKSSWTTIENTEIIDVTDSYTEIKETQNFHVLVYIPSNFTNLILSGNLSNIEILYNTNSTEYSFVAFDVLIITAVFEDQLVRANNPDVVFDLINPSFDSITKEGDEEDDITDDLRGLLVVVPVYIIIFVVISPMSLILISVTIEREQRTLETLFLQPVKRRDIVLGKIYYGFVLVMITLLLDIIAALVGVAVYILVSGSDLSEVIDQGLEQVDELGILVISGFMVALFVIAINIIAFAVLLSLLAKDEREANMISGILPLLLFGVIGLVFVIPIDEFNVFYQLIWVSLPVIGVIIAIYLSGLAGHIVWVSYISVALQLIWVYLTVNLITRISEAESIIELSYSTVFKQIKRFILRR